MEMKQQNRQEEEDEIIDIPLLLEASKSSIYTEWSKCCIYRVPNHLRCVNEAAYTPQLVSIGPLHHGKPDLKPLEKLKLRYMEEFCKRTGKSSDELGKIFDNGFEKEVRGCYAGTFDPKVVSNFVELILVDACFIIELLLRNWEDDKNDYILGKPWLKKSIELDLILLENQIPFFVLEEIYNQTEAWCHISKGVYVNGNENSCVEQEKKGKNNKMPYILQNCFFCHCQKFEDKECEMSKNQFKNCDTCSNTSPLCFTCLTRLYFSIHHFKYEGHVSGVKHITDLLRCYCCPSDEGLSKFEQCSRKNTSLHTATMLDQAGIEFAGCKATHLKNITFEKDNILIHFPCFNFSWLLKCLPCIFETFTCLKFKQPTLHLPEIEVNDSTERIFRNLMALEQCHYPNEAYVCNYVWLMDKLINTRYDVDLLIEKKVIVNFLGSSKELADLFNTLSRKIVETNSCYCSCIEGINKHCNNPLNRIMATLTSVYFRDFWRGTATIVGLIVLVVSIWAFLSRILK